MWPELACWRSHSTKQNKTKQNKTNSLQANRECGCVQNEAHSAVPCCASLCLHCAACALVCCWVVAVLVLCAVALLPVCLAGVVGGWCYKTAAFAALLAEKKCNNSECTWFSRVFAHLKGHCGLAVRTLKPGGGGKMAALPDAQQLTSAEKGGGSEKRVLV